MSDHTFVSKGEHGVYRRRIILHAKGARVFAALEDDFHHMYVDIAHDGHKVAEIRGETLRIPRSTCPAAANRLGEFRGLALTEGSAGIDARQQCTHLFDIARLAMTHALRGGRRQYDITVPDPVESRTHPEVRRDGQLVLDWDVLGKGIVAPPPFAGSQLFEKVSWKHFDPETLEAAMLLRRAVWISYGRTATAAVRKAAASGNASVMHVMPTSLMGACYSHQPEIYATGTRHDEYTYDFTDRPDGLLSELTAFSGGIPPSPFGQDAAVGE